MIDTPRLFPTITAHTGCDGSAENTVESALRGLGLGADIVEVDVRSDPGGRLFLWHHDVVELRSGAPLPVSSLRLEELRSLAHDGKVRFREAGARLTTFEELAAALAPTAGRINLDVKDERSAESVGLAVRAAGLDGRVVVTGCHIGWARLIKGADPSLPVFLNTAFDEAPSGIPSRDRIEEACRAAVDVGCCGLNVHHRFCAPPLIEAARMHELLVSAWTVAPGDGFARFVDMGVDNITTRHVAALVALRLERSGGGPAGHGSAALAPKNVIPRC